MHRKRLVDDWTKLVVNREQFTAIFDKIFEREGGVKVVPMLWTPEEIYDVECTHFACVPPVKLSLKNNRNAYWKWCEKTLKGKVLCFSSNDEDKEEWWGFTEKEDIMIWMLRWN
jgi:hypothetical protein